MTDATTFLSEFASTVWPYAALAVCALAGHGLVLRALRRVLRASGEGLWSGALEQLAAPARLAAVLFALQLGRAVHPLPPEMQPFAHKLVALGWIASLFWLAVALGGVLALWMQRTYDIAAKDNLEARKALTKVRLFRRMFTLFAGVLALAAALMVFDATRGIGASVLASAGIAGALAGLSAQKLLGLVLAGAQIALTQPIRLDDVVVVEGEWGRVEEIGLTYVVVRIWDERRLILPSSYFIDKPIQNWTRTSADILGSAFLCVDYAADVEAIRQELGRICLDAGREEAGRLWDGRVCVLQVTDTGPEVMTLRALVSSADSARNWDLRCLVRERLADYVRRNMPAALPLRRLSLGKAAAAREVGHVPAQG